MTAHDVFTAKCGHPAGAVGSVQAAYAELRGLCGPCAYQRGYQPHEVPAGVDLLPLWELQGREFLRIRGYELPEAHRAKHVRNSRLRARLVQRRVTAMRNAARFQERVRELDREIARLSS